MLPAADLRALRESVVWRRLERDFPFGETGQLRRGNFRHYEVVRGGGNGAERRSKEPARFSVRTTRAGLRLLCAVSHRTKRFWMVGFSALGTPARLDLSDQKPEGDPRRSYALLISRLAPASNVLFMRWPSSKHCKWNQ